MSFRGALVSLLGWMALGLASSRADDPLTAASFARLQALIRPQADESQWRLVPWLTSIWEARQRAAEEGKPILLWSGGGAAPIGGC